MKKSIGLVSEIILLGLAVLIVFLYIQPTWVKVGEIKSDTKEYVMLRGAAQQVNEELQRLANQIDSLEKSSVARLSTYLPTEIDDVLLLRDIEYILKMVNLSDGEVVYGGEVTESGDDETGAVSEQLATYQVNVTVDASYTELLMLLNALEQNQYPLQVQTMTVASSEDGELAVALDLITYTLKQEARTGEPISTNFDIDI